MTATRSRVKGAGLSGLGPGSLVWVDPLEWVTFPEVTTAIDPYVALVLLGGPSRLRGFPRDPTVCLAGR